MSITFIPKAITSLMLGALAVVVGGTAAAAPVPLAVDPTNVADEGSASVYYQDPNGLITAVSNANDTEYTGDVANNLMTITGALLGIQIDLAGATDLVELGTYVDPDHPDTDLYKSTDWVEFFVSTDGTNFTSVGVVEGSDFELFALDNFAYVSVIGDFPAVVSVRYLFHQNFDGFEGQRIAELVAFAPEDSDGDGVPDADDACPGTVIPEAVPTVRLGVNHWALFDGDLSFDTTHPRGHVSDRSYTTADTAGCSCSQIIEAIGGGAGLTKFGCPVEIMDDWVSTH